MLTGSCTSSECIAIVGVGGGERRSVGVEGNGGSSRRSSSVKLSRRRTERMSMLRLRIRSYRDGRAFNRGRRPTFINLNADCQLDGVSRQLLSSVDSRCW
jgi:hypothetical protein